MPCPFHNLYGSTMKPVPAFESFNLIVCRPVIQSHPDNFGQLEFLLMSGLFSSAGTNFYSWRGAISATCGADKSMTLLSPGHQPLDAACARWPHLPSTHVSGPLLSHFHRLTIPNSICSLRPASTLTCRLKSKVTAHTPLWKSVRYPYTVTPSWNHG